MFNFVRDRESFRLLTVNNGRLRLLILFTGIMCICSRAHALQPVFLRNSQESNICRSLEFLEDTSGKLSFPELLHPDTRERFVPVNASQLNFGITRSVYWVMFQLKFDQPVQLSPSELREHNPWILEIDRAWMPTLELWVPVAGDSPSVRQTALTEKERWRKLSAVTADQSDRLNLLNRNSIFFIPDDYDQNRAMYLKMASWGPPLNFSLYVTQLAEFRNRTTWDFAVFGCIYGLIVAMILYNACIYVSLRNATYLVYVLYMLANFFYLSMGLGQFSALTGIHPQNIFFILYVFSGSAIFFAAWFCRSFLRTSRNAPIVDKILTAYMFLAVIWVFMAVTRFYYQLQILSAAICTTFPIMAIAAGLVCLIKGVRPAGYFLAAWSALSIGIMVWALRGLGILPQTQLITYSYPVSVAVESILLSLALADRIRILQREKRQLEITERRLLVLSNTDGLTKLYNKRYFDEKLKSEIALSDNLNTPLSLIILDVDDFKKVNDTHGHPAGDQVLKRLGEIVSLSIRDNDCGCRYGGEEFAVILPGTKKEDVMDVADRIRQSVCDELFENTDGNKFSVTVSIGLAQLHSGDKNADLINRADQALYKAKCHGKNKVVA